MKTNNKNINLEPFANKWNGLASEKKILVLALGLILIGFLSKILLIVGFVILAYAVYLLYWKDKSKPVKEEKK